MKIKLFIFILFHFISLTTKGQLWQSAKTFSAFANDGYRQMEKFNQDKFILRSVDGYTSTLTVIDTSANITWTKSYPGLYFSNIQVVGDSIWTGGYFYDTIQINNQSYSSDQSSASFIAVLNSTGDIIRYKIFNSCPVGIHHIFLKNNKLYMTGGFINDLILGTDTLHGDSLVSALFIAVLDMSLVVEKSVKTQGGYSRGFCIRVDKHDEIIFLADVSYIVTMNGGYLSDPNGEYCTTGGQMLVKLDENLQLLWAKAINMGIRDNRYSSEIFLDSLNNYSVTFTGPSGSGAIPARGIEKYSRINGALLFQRGFGTCDGIFGQDDYDNFYSVGNTCSNFGISSFSIGKVIGNGQIAFSLLDSIGLPANVILPVGENDFYTVGGCGYTNEYCSENKSVLVHYKFGEAVSLVELNSRSKLKLYPNPNNGDFLIYFESAKFVSISITVTNQLGQPVLTRRFQNTTTLSESISLTHLDKGVYFLEVTSENETCVQKVVIK